MFVSALSWREMTCDKMVYSIYVIDEKDFRCEPSIEISLFDMDSLQIIT